MPLGIWTHNNRLQISGSVQVYMSESTLIFPMEEEEFNPTEVYEWDRNCAPTFIATIINVMLNLMMFVPI